MKNTGPAAWLVRSRLGGKKFCDCSAIAFPYPENMDPAFCRKIREISFAGKTRQEIKETVKKTCRDPKWVTTLINAMDRIVNEIKKDDFIAVPEGETIYIGRVVEPYVYKDREHQIKIKPLNAVSRINLSIVLRKIIRARYPVVSLRDDVYEIEALGYGKPFNNEVRTVGSMMKKSMDLKCMIRPNYEAKVTVPVDFTEAEAERLCAFIKLLPFDKGKK